MCGVCIDRFVASGPRCERCALRLPTVAALCGHCLSDPPPVRRCVCALDYAFPWSGLITEFKFNQGIGLAVPLAEQLLQAVARSEDERPSLLLPVPLSRARLAERGYNQSWELARHIARSLDTPAHPGVLERPVDGAHQAELPLAQRLRNLRGAFFVHPAQRDRVARRHVALVDDVMTSGATLREAAATLLRAGAARVDAWVLARTPAPSH